MKSAMLFFFQSYFNATENTPSWTAKIFDAEQRMDILNEVMQWDIKVTPSE
jgi:hypothetical protein